MRRACGAVMSQRADWDHRDMEAHSQPEMLNKSEVAT